jgi:hypothetical protein
MANICDNFVTCTGSATNITKFKKVIEDGIQFALTHLQATSLGIDIESGYFFEIYLNEQVIPTELTFSYTTKWSPNLQDLATLAKKHKLSMVCEYNECGMALYGKATIDRYGFINDDEVSAEFINLIEYNEETGCYEYDGVEYETEGDIINEKYALWKLNQ